LYEEQISRREDEVKVKVRGRKRSVLGGDWSLIEEAADCGFYLRLFEVC
jgi:hypothetical protein